MALTLHNTLTGNKEPFTPADPDNARIYVCGPTVYDFSHLGHARCYVIYDVLVRHLRSTGQKLTYCRNITDVEDKILKRAAENGETPRELSERFTKAYHEDMAALGNLEPDIEPRVSDHIQEIQDLIQRLIDKEAAYASDGDVYFHVEAFQDYGKLSHRDLDQMLAGASGRTEDDANAKKKHPADFALWKGATEGEGWESPWGRGRPGWHIECSAMGMKHLGESFDLHGGGLDLVFPHHENEIAQSEAATCKPYATLWMHNGFIEVDKTKMSKSLGNFFTARELFDRVEPEAMRYYCMTVHYRAPMNLDWSLDEAGNVTGFPQIEEAERRVEYMYQTHQRLLRIPEKRVHEAGVEAGTGITGLAEALKGALDDDLNMPQALAATAEFLRQTNELCDAAQRKKGKVKPEAFEAAKAGFALLKSQLGLGYNDIDEVLGRIRSRRAAARGLTQADVEAKIQERADARAAKDFARADAVRDELLEKGVELLDTPAGTDWRIS